MAAGAESLNKRRAAIQDMFSAIAPRYDLLNRVLSARRDVAWRQAAAAALELSPTELALDLCCGTGDQALALCQRRNGVVAADFSIAMLALARRKFRRVGENRPRSIAADSLELPLPASLFAGVTVSFGLRNVESLQAALGEILRVLAPGGRVAILEFALPEGFIARRIYLSYFCHVLPAIGRLLSPRGSAYRYLSESVMGFPQRQEFAQEMLRAGFSNPAWQDLSGGIVCLYTGDRLR